MARAPYNAVMNCYFGPDYVPFPVLAVEDVPCRLVLAEHIFPRAGQPLGVIGYVTFPNGTGMLLPDYNNVGTTTTIEWGVADILEIPADSGNYYCQVLVDVINDVATENYRRVWVAPFEW